MWIMKIWFLVRKKFQPIVPCVSKLALWFKNVSICLVPRHFATWAWKYSILLQKGHFYSIFWKIYLQIYFDSSISEAMFQVKKWKITQKNPTFTLFNFLDSVRNQVEIWDCQRLSNVSKYLAKYRKKRWRM